MLKKYYSITGYTLFALLLFFAHPDVATGQAAADWEQEMQEFEKADEQFSYPDDSIFFTGSSSIRLWETLEEDMAPYSVIPRGFGGSKMADLLHYADRYIRHHQFRAMVLFVANDIVGNAETDRTPQQVYDLFEEFIQKVKEYNPDAFLFIIEITPTNSRWLAWPQIKEANHLLARLSDNHQNVMYIPTRDLFLTADGTPNDDLFVSDRLHLNEPGYEVWAKRIRSYINPVLLDR